MAPVAPAFQFYANDFLTGTLSLSLEECGAYVTLLAYQWDHGAVPDGHAARARICRCSLAQVKRVWIGIATKFQQGPDGLWRNARLERERDKQAAYRELQRDKGLASARTRWGTKPKPSHQPDGQPGSNRALTEPVTGHQPDGQPKGNSSSSSSSSYVPSKNDGTPPRPLISGEANPRTWGKIHGEHVAGFCDWVCLPEFVYLQWVRGSPGPEYVMGWARAVRGRFEGQTIGDNLKFWRARWDESHPEKAEKPKPEPFSIEKALANVAARKAGTQ